MHSFSHNLNKGEGFEERRVNNKDFNSHKMLRSSNISRLSPMYLYGAGTSLYLKHHSFSCIDTSLYY